MKHEKEPESNVGKHEKRTEHKGLRRTLMIVGIVLGVIAVLWAAVYLVVNSYLGKINYDDGRQDESSVSDDADVPVLPEEDEKSDAPDSAQDVIDQATNQIEENLSQEDLAVRNTEELTNILLIGSDTRQSGTAGRSDTMMLLTIDREREIVALTSLMRDMYVYVPDHGNMRINAAYAYGGAQLLIDTIEANFKIEIDNYAAIDFYAFVEAIDAIGGVTMDISYDEFYGVNLAIEKYNKIIGDPYDDGLLTTSGEDILLTGKQALGYARNRHFPMGDFDRTAHQRKLVEALFARAKSADLSELDALLDAVLPGVTTDMSQVEILSWMVLAPSILQYEFSTYRIPIDGAYGEIVLGGADMLSVDFEKNIAELHRIIYGE